MQIRFEPGGTAPLYKQLADAILGGILRGELVHGEKLPTVRELSVRLGVSVGTVKRAYEELAARDAVRLVQGSGTFVNRQETGGQDRKERATAAIDAMLDTLETLHFSPREIEMFLELKLRERWEPAAGVRVALVDASGEALTMLSDQLAALENVELYPVLAAQARESLIPEELDLIAAPEETYAQLRRTLSVPEEKLLCLVAGATRRTAAALGSLRGAGCGVMAASERFAQRLAVDCSRYSGAQAPAQRLFGAAGAAEDFLAPLTALVVPECYRRLCPGGELAALTAFARAHRLIRYEYRLDRGSFLSLQRRVREIGERRED